MHVCTRFCVCAGHCVSMGMSGGHGIHAKHMGEGCSRHALYMHVTMHIHAWEHILSQTHRDQPCGGTHKHFVGCMCFSMGCCIYFSKFTCTDMWGDMVLPGPYVTVLVHVSVHVCARPRAYVCTHVCLQGCVPFLVGVRCFRASGWAAAASSMTLHVCVGPELRLCVTGVGEHCWALPR